MCNWFRCDQLRAPSLASLEAKTSEELIATARQLSARKPLGHTIRDGIQHDLDLTRTVLDELVASNTQFDGVLWWFLAWKGIWWCRFSIWKLERIQRRCLDLDQHLDTVLDNIARVLQSRGQTMSLE